MQLVNRVAKGLGHVWSKGPHLHNKRLDQTRLSASWNATGQTSTTLQPQRSILFRVSVQLDLNLYLCKQTGFQTMPVFDSHAWPCKHTAEGPLPCKAASQKQVTGCLQEDTLCATETRHAMGKQSRPHLCCGAVSRMVLTRCMASGGCGQPIATGVRGCNQT